MFDSHCHLDFDAYDEDREAVIERARDAGVTAIHVPGVGPNQWARAAAVCAASDGLGVGVGIHPWWIGKLAPAQLDAALAGLAEAATRSRAEAIGECGLDGSVAKRGGPGLDEQERVLDAHLEVARALSLPVVLHVVGAHGRALDVLRRHGALPRGGMLHSYSGSVELIEPYRELGLYFSFGGVVTRQQARKPRAAVVAVPAARLLLESDGPDQPLQDHERSVPADLAVTCAQVAELRGAPSEAVAQQTAANAMRLFGRPA
jgi:TatD DNase family protein